MAQALVSEWDVKSMYHVTVQENIYPKNTTVSRRNEEKNHYAYLQTIILISYNLILNDRSVPRVKGRGLWGVLVSACRVVLNKKCSENMQQIYRIIPMLKFNFNKVALHFNLLAITLQHRQSSINLLHIFRTAFLESNA